LTHKYFAGAIPEPGTFGPAENTLVEVLNNAPQLVSTNLENFKFRQALTEMMVVARAGNKYLAETEPWKLIKTEPERVATILYLANQTSALLALLMEPFLPFSAKKLRKMLPEFDTYWPEGQNFKILKSGSLLGESKILFTKITDEEVQNQLDKLEKSKKENIDVENFGKMDIRMATILEAENVAKTKKLLKLKLDTGLDERTVVSGIAEHYKPEDIVGKQVMLLANLAPREIKGIISQGMILMAQDADGKLVFAEPSVSVRNGSQVT